MGKNGYLCRKESEDLKALIVYSGGMDSTTLLYQYKDCISLAVTFT